MSNVDVLKANGFANADAMVSAAQRIGLPIWIAAAFVERESKGLNIYGHDKGGLYPGAVVTDANYQMFYDAVINKHHISNGVGPMQITWPGFLTDAKAKGYNLARVYDNFLYGFNLISGYLGKDYSQASIAAAGKRYNGASAYGAAVAKRAAYWQGKVNTTLTRVTTTPTLRKGSTGNAVRTLQNGLNRVFPAYARLTVDGRFGANTERVIIEFQGRAGLTPDGVVGPLTKAKLADCGVRF